MHHAFIQNDAKSVYHFSVISQQSKLSSDRKKSKSVKSSKTKHARVRVGSLIYWEVKISQQNDFQKVLQFIKDTSLRRVSLQCKLFIAM